MKRQVRSVIHRLVARGSTSLPALAPQTRVAHRRLRMVFPPAFPERTAGLFAIMRYLAADNVSGDVVECGVGRGVSFYVIGCFMAKLEHPGRLFGFDSFKGFPLPSAHDASARNASKGEWADTSPEHVRGHFIEGGIDDFFQARCRLIPGFFEETLTGTLPFSGISLLHLDVDLYESYRITGEVLGPLVAPNGIVLFDEYNQPSWPGATKAVDEMLEKGTRVLLYSRLMNKYLGLEAALWNRPTPALEELRSALQLERAAARPANA